MAAAVAAVVSWTNLKGSLAAAVAASVVAAVAVLATVALVLNSSQTCQTQSGVLSLTR